ncbi:hypothetical protein BCR42DRAFT_426321, partial [Absidia repens]
MACFYQVFFLQSISHQVNNQLEPLSLGLPFTILLSPVPMSLPYSKNHAYLVNLFSTMNGPTTLPTSLLLS